MRTESIKTSKSFFSGNEIHNIARELYTEPGKVENEIFKCVDYSQFIYRIAEILEIKNIDALEIVLEIVFDCEFSEELKIYLKEMIKNKDNITYQEFRSTKRKSFSAMINQIKKVTHDIQRQRRIEHAFLDALFYDLKKQENIISSRLMSLKGIELSKYSERTKVVSILENNGFILASRDIVKILSDDRSKKALDAYRGGYMYCSAGDVFWDTSKDIRYQREYQKPKGVTIISTSPTPEKNPGYLFNRLEIDVLTHYFEMVRKAELEKGNCFDGIIEEYYKEFSNVIVPRMEKYLTKVFGENWVKLEHMILTGIGGNEMFAHQIQTYARLYNPKIHVHLITFPSKWDEEIEENQKKFIEGQKKYKKITKYNLLVIALTRSGKTYETAMTCEFISKIFNGINLIGVSNGGKIIELTEYYSGLAISFPQGIAGRLSTLNTPVFPLPMAIIDKHATTKVLDKFMNAAHKYDVNFSLKNLNSLAWCLAKKIYLSSYINGMKLKIYQGSNSKRTKSTFRHMEQVIMEGIKHDISCLLPKSMPDAAHFNMEQTLKLGENYYHFWIIEKTPLKGDKANILLNGININEQLGALIKGQFEKIKQKSPIDIVLVDDINDIDTQAFIYKLIENSIYYLARLIGDDPEGNPDVKDVRDLSSKAAEIFYKRKSQRNADISKFYLELEDFRI